MNSEHFIGPVTRLLRSRVISPRTRFGERLRLCQIRFASPQSRLRLLALAALGLQRLIGLKQILTRFLQLIPRPPNRFFGAPLSGSHPCDKNVRKEDDDDA